MGLYKETDYAFAELAKCQTQIYNDACDIGIRVTSTDSTFYKKIQSIMSDDFLTGSFRKHREDRDIGSMRTISVTIHLPWEQYDTDVYSCTTWKINYIMDRVRKINFFTFDAARTVQKEREIYKND